MFTIYFPMWSFCLVLYSLLDVTIVHVEIVENSCYSQGGEQIQLGMVTSDFKNQLPGFLGGSHPSIKCIPALKPYGLIACLLFAWTSCIVTFIT